MADKIWDSSKHLFDGRQNAPAHVMDHRHGHSVTGLKLLEKGDELRGFLGRNFPIAQDDLGKGIQAAHQHGPATFTRAIQVKNVTALVAHGLAQARSAPSMSQGQVNHKLLSQIVHFAGAEANVAPS